MKALNEYLKEYIQNYIFEVSDDLLKRAIDKCYAQNTVLMRRRAKEFEKYLNDPERIKREELSNQSKVTQQFAKAYDEYIIKAYELYDSGKKKDSIPYFNSFGNALGKIINEFSTSNITVETTGKFHTFNKSCLKGRGYYLDPSPGISFTKKRGPELFEYDGVALKIFFTLKADEEKLISHDYRKRIEARLVIQFYKKENRGNYGEYSTYLDMPWHSIPLDFEDEFKSIYQKISDLRGKEMDERVCKHYIGEDSLTKKLPGWELLNNSFYAHMDDHSIKDAIERMVDVLKQNDPNCKIEFKNTSDTTHGTNSYYGNANILASRKNVTATLTYNGVEYEITGVSDGSGWSEYGKILVNGETIFGASKEQYDDGCWVGGKYKPYSALEKFFKD